MDEDAFLVADKIESGLVRAIDLLDILLQQIREEESTGISPTLRKVYALALAARREVDEAVLLVPAIGSVSFVADELRELVGDTSELPVEPPKYRGG